MRPTAITLVFLSMVTLANAQGTISTIAGNATCCNGADGGLATARWLTAGNGLAIDASGNIYFYETASSIVRKIDAATGILTTYAGNRNPGFSGDGGPATGASLFPIAASLSGIAFDASGNLFISDGNNHRVRKVTPAGVISTYAGNGNAGFAGDNGPAPAAQLNFPGGLAVDAGGNLYIADSSNNRIRRVTPAGTITTFAGNGNVTGNLGEGGPATAAPVRSPFGLTFDGQGNLYVSETSESRVRKIMPAGIITVFAGQAVRTNGFAGDGGPATAAQLSGPLGLVADQFGAIFIADAGNSRIRKVDAAGIITTIAGIDGNASTPLGDGGPSTAAFLGNVRDLVIDSAGHLYLSASAGGSMRVRRIAATGAGFVATPSSLSFSATTGSAPPAAQSVNIASTGAALGFTVAAASTGNWLSVTPNSGTTPASINVSVNHAGLGSGTYNGTITITPMQAGNSPLAINVTLTVSGAGAPVISGVFNATGYQTNLAPGVVFVVFGSNMGPAQLQQAAAPDYPADLAGTSITFTPANGGAAITARLVYTLAGQVAAILPSSAAPGTYAVRLTYNGLTSAPRNVTVVARSFGIATSNSAGSGIAQATIGNINNGLSLTRFNAGSVNFNGFTWTLTPAHPGDTLVLWGTGGGADIVNDSGGTSGDQTAQGNFRVIVGTREIVPLYAGTSSGYPGLWQINFTLPPDIAIDCFTTVRVTAGGESSNTVVIPIAAAGQTSCVDPTMAPSILSKLDGGGTITFAGFALAKQTETLSNITQETASGAVFRFTPTEWIILNSGPVFGACRVYDRTYAVGGKDPGAASTNLDAGARLDLTGPNLPGGFGLGRQSLPTGVFYSNSPTLGTYASGTYTLTGTGGPHMGAFTVSTVFPASFNATNFASITSINRAQPLTFTWTGTGFDTVGIIVNTAVTASGNQHITTINCMVPAGPGTYTIPAAALAYLSPAAATGNAFGSIALQGINTQGTFTATLFDGGQIDLGVLNSILSVGKNVPVQ